MDGLSSDFTSASPFIAPARVSWLPNLPSFLKTHGKRHVSIRSHRTQHIQYTEHTYGHWHGRFPQCFLFTCGEGGGFIWRHCCGKSTRGRFVLIVGSCRDLGEITIEGPYLTAFFLPVTVTSAPRRDLTRTRRSDERKKAFASVNARPSSQDFICNRDVLTPSHLGFILQTHTQNNWTDSSLSLLHCVSQK